MKKYIYPVLTFAWMVLIFYFSSRSGEISHGQSVYVLDIFKMLFPFLNLQMTEDIIFVLRKFSHSAEYAILGVLFFKSYTQYGFSRLKSWKISILCCFLYAISDEVHQIFVPGRTARVLDVCIDTCGAALGLILLRLLGL